MRYKKLIDDNQISSAYNIDFTEIIHPNDVWSFSDLENGDLNAPMVNNVNISGKLVADSEKTAMQFILILRLLLTRLT